MTTRVHRSINDPIRSFTSWVDRWKGPDKGLIWCWELGRQLRESDRQLADRTSRGELVTLVWRGGVEQKLKTGKKIGSLFYLATWQGLRGEDLEVHLVQEQLITCSRTGQTVIFRMTLPDDAIEENVH